ncbi:MAG TPA: hypothetical protein VG408_00250 [Actinomycetota bacterium]|nr:hypothetical protein [Actinomycetota bacterium]
MAEREPQAPQEEGLSKEELGQQASEEVGEREEMSLINANLAAPVNAAVAANILSDDSVAYANAEQDVDIDQST